MDLEIRKLRLAFGEKDILREMDLPKISGNILALIGPSGGGKSTLLRVWGGLLKPDAGEVLIDGEPLPTSEKNSRLYRQKIGVVFQNWNLFYHLTALQNIMLPLTEVQGVSSEDAEQTAMSLLDRFQLTEHAEKRPHQLSGGQQQRVAIVRALAINPRFLLLDEPTSALDPEMAAQVLEMIEEVAEQGTPVILVTHHVAFASRVSDYVLFLSEGRILEHAPTQEFFENPKTEICRKFLETVLKM